MKIYKTSYKILTISRSNIIHFTVNRTRGARILLTRIQKLFIIVSIYNNNDCSLSFLSLSGKCGY